MDTMSVDTIAALADPVVKGKLQEQAIWSYALPLTSFKLSSKPKSISGAPLSGRSGSRPIKNRIIDVAWHGAVLATHANQVTDGTSRGSVAAPFACRAKIHRVCPCLAPALQCGHTTGK
jgi:hypothetical protein